LVNLSILVEDFDKDQFVISPAENLRSRDYKEIGTQTELLNYFSVGSQTEMPQLVDMAINTDAHLG
jgi:hypothetical protein